MKTLKNFLLNLTILKVLKSLVCILLSFYLTYYLKLHMMSSIWSCLFMAGYFIAVFTILLNVGRRFHKFVPKPETVLFSIAVAVLIMVGFGDFFSHSTQETFVTLVSETAGEICLCNVIVDGKEVRVADVEVVENSGWLYREKYDNFMIWPEEDGVENRLVIRFFAKEVYLGFPFTPYAGSVSITSSNGYGGTWNLRYPEELKGGGWSMLIFSLTAVAFIRYWKSCYIALVFY